ncbi:unnamed protein product [Meganyctiphanes norvegica]|uniref:Uncharacterized protein n=1 Tax=Meganyctiphanes norvegica TaxID=48144 RepID=A0AAV2PR68_MEGNR
MVLVWCVGVLVVVALVIRVVHRGRSGRCRCTNTMEGKTVIITGASAGIGKETALDIAKRGARVILACRNITKAQLVADNIIAESGNKNLVVRCIDTTDLNSVRNFAKETLQIESRIDVLINNAGIGGSPVRKVTSDGLESTMAANHYGHFLLTNLLLPLLKKSSPSRIVNVASSMHWKVPSFDVDDLNFERNYSSFQSYIRTKLVNMLFNLELSQRLSDTGVTVNCLHPGTVSTEIFGKSGNKIGKMFGYVYKVLGKDAALGAQTNIHCAVSEDLINVTGKYFSDCKEAPTSELAQDKGLAKKIWEASEEHVGLKPEEIHC